MTIPVYNTGTVSVSANGTVVSGGGTTIWGNNVREGDWIVIDGAAITMVLAVTDDDHLVIPEWQFGAKTNVEYAIYQNYSARADVDEVTRDLGKLVAALNKEGFIWFVGPAESEPDPSNGDEGQWAFQPSTGKQWHKEGGTWVYDGIFKGLGTPAPYDNGKTYSLNDVASSGGTSYIWSNATPGSGHAPPNATYWTVLAAKGEQGAQGDRGAGYGGTSSSSVAVALGARYWVVPLTYAYEIGSRVRATDPTAPSNWVEGAVIYYGFDGTANYLGVEVDKVSGSGIRTSWKFSLAGQPAPTYGGTSTTSSVIGAGPKVFTTQENLAYATGARVRASSGVNWMEGVATYSGSTLTINVDRTNGSGTFSAWNFNVAGQPGAGDLSSANNLSDLTDKAAAFQNLITGNKPIVILATGQSNFEVGIVHAWTPEVNAFVWNWTHVDGTVGTAFVPIDSTKMNAPQRFASEVARANPDRKVYVINISISGTAIRYWMNGASGPNMWGNVTANVAAALTSIGVASIDALLWWQGNADWGTPYEGNYPAYFEALISQFKAQSWYPPETPVQIIGLGSNADSTLSGYDRFNDVLEFCASRDNELRRYIDASTFTGTTYWQTGGGIGHMTAAGYKALGALMAREFMSGAKNATVHATARDALAMSGFQRNGSHLVSQLSGSNAVAMGVGNRLTDGWFGVAIGPAANAQRVATPFASRPDIPFGLRVTVTTAKPSLASTDQLGIYTMIEGGEVSRLGMGTSIARPFSYKFLVNSSVNLVGYVVTRNGGGNRTMYRRFELTAGVDKWVEARFPGCPDGVWNSDTGTGMFVNFVFAAGSGLFGTPDAWLTGSSSFCGSDQGNLAAALSNTVTMSGAVFVPGLYLPSDDHMGAVIRPRPDEMRKCRRYIETSYDDGVLPGTSTTASMHTTGLSLTASNVDALVMPIRFVEPKRALPSEINVYSPLGTASKALDLVSGTEVNVFTAYPGTKGFRLLASPSPAALGVGIGAHWVAICD